MENFRFKVFLIGMFIFSCHISFGQQKINRVLCPSTIAFTIDEKDLFPEGITYDSKTKQFFLSSLYKEKVIAIDKSGKQSDFIQSRQDGMLRSLGMKVDVERRRLWIVSDSDWSDSLISVVHIFNIDTKKLERKLFTEKGKIPAFNDLIVTKDGDAYISDWKGNSIYYVPSDLSKVELFLKSDSLLVGANGMAASPDNSFLYVSSYEEGIVLVDLKSKSINPIGNQMSVDTRGIDGLMLYKNSLIGISNGDTDLNKHYIARYELGTDGREIIFGISN